MAGDLDLDKLNDFLGGILEDQWQNMYRMKGVLSVEVRSQLPPQPRSNVWSPLRNGALTCVAQRRAHMRVRGPADTRARRRRSLLRGFRSAT